MTALLRLVLCLAGAAAAAPSCARQEAAPGEALVQAASARLSRAALNTGNAQGKVLFLLRTWHGNYDGRIQAVLETWANDLNSNDSALLIVGDRPDPKGHVEEAQGCGQDIGIGLACRAISGLSLALKREDWDWLFVADDDTYISTDRVVAALRLRDHTRAHGLGVLGCSGCAAFGFQQTGFCGGAGYALSRAAVERMVPAGEAEARGVFLSMAHRLTGSYDDVCMACYAHAQGVALESLDRLYAWHLNTERTFSTAYAHEIDQGALSFHYLSLHQMRKVHKLFEKARAKRGERGLALLDSDGALVQAHRHDRDQYLEVENERRASNIWAELVSPRVDDWF